MYCRSDRIRICTVYTVTTLIPCSYKLRIFYKICLLKILYFSVLDVSAFERLLGSCMDMMRDRVKDYEEQLIKAFGSKVIRLQLIKVFGFKVIRLQLIKAFGSKVIRLQPIKVFGSTLIRLQLIKAFSSKVIRLQLIKAFGSQVIRQYS